ncbi:hypothetical protein NL676_024775 [Syzygium grande]|nr:hypothetical protein NL676_024775 [Syzygium grande]
MEMEMEMGSRARGDSATKQERSRRAKIQRSGMGFSVSSTARRIDRRDWSGKQTARPRRAVRYVETRPDAPQPGQLESGRERPGNFRGLSLAANFWDTFDRGARGVISEEGPSDWRETLLEAVTRPGGACGGPSNGGGGTRQGGVSSVVVARWPGVFNLITRTRRAYVGTALAGARPPLAWPEALPPNRSDQSRPATSSNSFPRFSSLKILPGSKIHALVFVPHISFVP